MRSLFFFILFALALCSNLYGQDKRFLVFYAKKESWDDKTAGHAFISFIKEDPIQKMTIVEGCWGFYPKKTSQGVLSIAIGSVEGNIKDDFLTQKDVGLTVEVNKSEYENALLIKDKWNSKQYELTVSDCVSFVIEIAQSLSGKLNLPQRGFFDLPHSYIEELKLLNDPENLCPAHPDIVTTYDKNGPNYHFYSLSEEICDSKINPCCTEEFVFNVMRSRAEYTAPYGGNNYVMDCHEVDLPILGSIVTKLGEKPYSITNFTKENHVLHKGKVVRYVVKVGTKVNVYTVGIGNNRSQVKAWLNQFSLSVNLVWGKVNKLLREEVQSKLEEKVKSGNCIKNTSSTLFLFDLSGSMNDRGTGSTSKLSEAKIAAKQTLDGMKNNASGIQPEVGVLGFRGACVENPTFKISGFETDFSEVEKRINQMTAGGGTPLGKAIEKAECKLAERLIETNQQKGKLIILSDGQATCSNIRPPGIYNSGNLGQKTTFIQANHCGGGSTAGAPQVSYYTVGFNIPPGSPAERDLQFLAQISGGKYLNAQNQVELHRAFRRFSRTYIPKPAPSTLNLSASSIQHFNDGLVAIKKEKYDEAMEACMAFTSVQPNDCNGHFNLALMKEANDYYGEAIEGYKKYLSLCPDATDETKIQAHIKNLQEEQKQFLKYQKEVVKSDLEFLKIHFERMQNGESVALAEEFKGFLKEKGDYYEKLPRLIASDDQFLAGITEDIASAMKQCKLMIRKSPSTWDRDAIPLISMSYVNLKDLLEEM